MNITKAKAIRAAAIRKAKAIKEAKTCLQIPPDRNIRSATGREYLHTRWKKLVIEARKTGNEKREADLNEANVTLEELWNPPGRCAKCNTPIARGAKHCLICEQKRRRPKALPLSCVSRDSYDPPTLGPERRLPTSALAICGYWATPAQVVVAKWKDRIGEYWCKHYMRSCAACIFGDSGPIHIEPAATAHRPFILEMLLALYGLWTDKSKPAAWLLRLAAIGSDVRNGRYIPPGYIEIRKTIISRGGPTFSTAQLAQTAKRLRFNDKERP